MMIRLTRLALFVLGVGCPVLFAAEPATLKVSVENVPAKTEKVTILLYDDANDLNQSQSGKMVSKSRQKWDLQHSYQDVKPTAGAAQFEFKQLKAGEYAAFVFCDKNGNGRLDNSLLGLPSEHVGMSGTHANGKMSFPPKEKPSWKTMKFSVQPGANEIQIKAFKIGF
ncbi:MAG: DUF2141 domain-containing protein [Planctomycetota bacterium]